MSFIFHSVNIVYHNTDLCMLTHPWIPEINLIWSQCMVPFLCCWIWFANVLLKKIDIYIHQRYWSEFSTTSVFVCMGKYHSFISEGHHFHIKYFRIIGFFLLELLIYQPNLSWSAKFLLRNLIISLWGVPLYEVSCFFLSCWFGIFLPLLFVLNYWEFDYHMSWLSLLFGDSVWEPLSFMYLEVHIPPPAWEVLAIIS